MQNVDKVSRTLCTTKFKFEENGRQYDFNASRLVEVSRAKELLDRGSTNAALRILEQAEKSLKERNKIFRIADKYGWDVVEEYMDDPITENTDDATKLRQAEYRAKIKRREKVRQPQRTSPYYRNPDSERATSDLFRRPGATYSEVALGGKGAAATATVSCIANQNIMLEKRTRAPNVSIATEKNTGLTNAHKRHPDSHQQPNTSKETVKYNFLILHDREHKFENSFKQFIFNG